MHLKFYYFNFPFWRAEPCRIALHASGIPFEDIRLSGPAFREMKDAGELPYGQLPVLDVDGVRIAQSLGIARFCAKLSGLYPESDLAAAKVDEIMSTADQITALLQPSMGIKDPAKKAAHRAELAQTTLQFWLERLALRLEGEHTVLANGLTMADLILWRLFGWLTSGILDGMPTTLLEPHPKLVALCEYVEQHELVQNWRTHCGA